MPIRLHDTRRREKVNFTTLEPGKVSMYVCGVTVYDRCHLGHARCYLAFDLIHRWLESSGYDVQYVQNFTDIDDKIIHRANELDGDWKALVDQNIEAYYEDMDAVGAGPVLAGSGLTSLQEKRLNLIGDFGFPWVFLRLCQSDLLGGKHTEHATGRFLKEIDGVSSKGLPVSLVHVDAECFGDFSHHAEDFGHGFSGVEIVVHGLGKAFAHPLEQSGGSCEWVRRCEVGVR